MHWIGKGSRALNMAALEPLPGLMLCRCKRPHGTAYHISVQAIPTWRDPCQGRYAANQRFYECLPLESCAQVGTDMQF